MNQVNHYKEKFWDYSNDELKDIIAGRFGTSSNKEIMAAIDLLKERKVSKQEELSLDEIAAVSTVDLLAIIKNPSAWGTEFVSMAEAEILRREQKTTPASTTNKTFIQTILAMFGIATAFILLKIVLLVSLIGSLIYSVVYFLYEIIALLQ